MLKSLLRDTFAGQVVYYASGRRVWRYREEEPDFVVPERFLPGAREKLKQRKSSRSSGQKAAAPVDHEAADATSPRPSDSDETIVESDEPASDPYIVDWYGPDDPDNPMNWTLGAKIFTTFCICLMTTSVYAGSSIYSPGIEQVMLEWQVSQVKAVLGLSIFVLGYAVGPMVLSPITEIPSMGRTWPYIITLALYVILQVPTALVSNYPGFIVLRFLAGFVGSPPLATGGASVSDMFEPKTRPYAMGVWGLSAAAGPALGPVMSSFAIQYESWRWAFWIMLWLSGGSLAFLIFTLPETSALNILVRRADRLRRKTGNNDLRSLGEIEQANMQPSEIVQMTLIRPLKMTVSEPIVTLLNLYISFVYALLYCWFESFPLVYGERGFYGFSLGISTLPFLALLVGAVIGFLGFSVWNKLYLEKRFDRSHDGTIAPELRLPPAIVAAPCYPICLFWFAWSAGRTHWIVPVIGSTFFGIGTSLAFQSVLNYLPDAYPKYAASVLASNDFSRGVFGFAFPLFANAMFSRLGIDWGNSLLGFISIGLMPIPLFFWFYGARVRRASKMAESPH